MGSLDDDLRRYTRGGPVTLESLHDELKELRLRVDARRPPSTPPPRDREQSSHDWREFAEVVKRAALEGEHRRDTTPDETVQHVVAETLAKRDMQRELERLQFEQQTRRDAKEARDKLAITTIASFIGGLALAILVNAALAALRGHW